KPTRTVLPNTKREASLCVKSEVPVAPALSLTRMSAPAGGALPSTRRIATARAEAGTLIHRSTMVSPLTIGWWCRSAIVPCLERERERESRPARTSLVACSEASVASAAFRAPISKLDEVAESYRGRVMGLAQTGRISDRRRRKPRTYADFGHPP